MSHTTIRELFDSVVTLFTDRTITEWFPNGKDSIRIRFKDRNEVIFTINNDSWIIESTDNFIQRITN